MPVSVTELPFNQLIGLQAANSSDGLVQLPGGQQYHNHIGTVHAAAQLAVGEGACGELLLREFGDRTGWVPVVRRVEAKFHKPAHGKIVGTIPTRQQIIDTVRNDLASRSRAIVRIPVEIHDELGQLTLTATFDWFIAKQS